MSWITQVRERARGRLAAARQADDLEPAEHPGDQFVVVEPSEPTVDEAVPRALRTAAAWAWRLVVIVAAAYLLLRLIGILRLVVIPVIVALLLAALLEPAASRLRRHGVGRSLSAAIVLVTGLIVVFGTLGLVIQTFIGQFDNLSDQVESGIAEVQRWLAQGPLNLSQSQLDNLLDQARETLTNNQDSLTAGALSTATTVGEVVTGFFLVLFTLFFFLRDGGAIWRFVTRLLPRPAEAPVYQAGRYSWSTLSSYVRATIVVAFVDAVGIGIGLFVLQVPLALPLAALVFLGAFIPVIGATLSGAVAVLVALVAQGPVTALIVLGVVIAVQQLEGHVLQPLIMGRAVSLHPLAVILAIAAGLVLAGIVGGLVAVPVLAVLNTAVRYLASYDRGRPSRADKPPGTRPVDDEQAEVEAKKDAEAGEAGASVGTGATTVP